MTKEEFKVQCALGLLSPWQKIRKGQKHYDYRVFVNHPDSPSSIRVTWGHMTDIKIFINENHPFDTFAPFIHKVWQWVYYCFIKKH